MPIRLITSLTISVGMNFTYHNIILYHSYVVVHFGKLPSAIHGVVHIPTVITAG